MMENACRSLTPAELWAVAGDRPPDQHNVLAFGGKKRHGSKANSRNKRARGAVRCKSCEASTTGIREVKETQRTCPAGGTEHQSLQSPSAGLGWAGLKPKQRTPQCTLRDAIPLRAFYRAHLRSCHVHRNILNVVSEPWDCGARKLPPFIRQQAKRPMYVSICHTACLRACVGDKTSPHRHSCAESKGWMGATGKEINQCPVAARLRNLVQWKRERRGKLASGALMIVLRHEPSPTLR